MKNHTKTAVVVIALTLLIFVVGILAVLKNPMFLGFKTLSSRIDFIERSSALIAYQLLVVQLVLGINIKYLKYTFRLSTSSLHKYLGLLLVFTSFIHPMALLTANIISKKIIDPFYVFSDFCLLCDPKTELYMSLGRFAVWIIGLIVVSSLLRLHSWWDKYWKYIHKLSYPVFILVSLHAYKIGSDMHTTIFYPVFITGIILVLVSLFLGFYFSKKSS